MAKPVHGAMRHTQGARCGAQWTLAQKMQLRKVRFLDTVFEGTKADDGGFDADVAIATGELVKLIPDVIEALGGEAKGQ